MDSPLYKVVSEAVAETEPTNTERAWNALLHENLDDGTDALIHEEHSIPKPYILVRRNCDGPPAPPPRTRTLAKRFRWVDPSNAGGDPSTMLISPYIFFFFLAIPDGNLKPRNKLQRLVEPSGAW